MRLLELVLILCGVTAFFWFGRNAYSIARGPCERQGLQPLLGANDCWLRNGIVAGLLFGRRFLALARKQAGIEVAVMSFVFAVAAVADPFLRHLSALGFSTGMNTDDALGNRTGGTSR